MTLCGHGEAVTGVDFVDKMHMVSSSWDHSLRMWDVAVGGMVSQVASNVALLCIAYSHQNGTAIVGCSDRQIRLYDPRARSKFYLVSSKMGPLILTSF